MNTKKKGVGNGEKVISRLPIPHSPLPSFNPQSQLMMRPFFCVAGVCPFSLRA
jgi:hypothetical protein